MFKRAKFDFLILGAEYHTNNNHFGQSYSRAKVGEKYKENANFTHSHTFTVTSLAPADDVGEGVVGRGHCLQVIPSPWY